MVSDRVAHDALNYIETIAGLSYLIRTQTTDPEVNAYAEQIEQQSLALGAFLRSVTRQLKDAGS